MGINSGNTLDDTHLILFKKTDWCLCNQKKRYKTHHALQHTMLAKSIYAKKNNIEVTMLELTIMKLSLNNLFSQIIDFDLKTLDG